VESLWLDLALTHISFAQVAADVLPSMQPKEFFRPGQIDRFGNFNNIAFGRDYLRPRLRLPGTGGIPDVTTYISDIHLYIPRHSRVTFVENLDFISGLGHNPLRKQGKGPQYLVTDLGQFDFAPGYMRLTSIHPGVEIEQIRAHTGFTLEITPDVDLTPAPTSEELGLLREEIDPLNIRRLELLSGAARRQLLHEIIDHEMDIKSKRIVG
jgi:hypothetical protein